MNSVQVAIELKRLVASGRNFFLKCQPEVLDFTVPTFSGEVVICSAMEELRLQLTAKELVPLLGLLNAAFFGDKDVSIIGWNVKNLATFIKYHTKATTAWECKCFDLKPIEVFLGIPGEAPNSLAEAAQRVKAIFADDGWPRAKLIYNKVHTPLMFEVIPAIESQGIYDVKQRKALYSYYEIEGQVNGRLLCYEAYRNSYVPHTMMGPDGRERFRPKGADELFMYFDYRNMEVSMLQWLSQDDRLGQVLALDDDLYTVVFKLVSGAVCDSKKKRDMCKSFLLPVIYGQSAGGLAKKLEVSQGTAEGIIGRVRNLFPTSSKWIQDFCDNTDSVGVDYMGRKRRFDATERGAVRNFAVQAPAALVCLEKLIALHNKIKGYARIACHIHDGYLLYVSKAATKMVADMAKEVLEQDSELAPGLRLRCACTVGPTLAELRALE